MDNIDIPEEFTKEYESKLEKLKTQFSTIFINNQIHLDEPNFLLWSLSFLKAGQIYEDKKLVDKFKL